MQNPIFNIFAYFHSYKGPLEEIEHNSDGKYNLILAPKILIHTYTQKPLMDFNYLGHDYTLIGLLGSELDERRSSIEYEKIDHLGDYDYSETITIEHIHDVNHFFCICKELKTNKWFKYIDNKIEEIEIVTNLDTYTNKLLFSYNNGNKKENNPQNLNIQIPIYYQRYLLLLYKKIE